MVPPAHGFFFVVAQLVGEVEHFFRAFGYVVQQIFGVALLGPEDGEYPVIGEDTPYEVEVYLGAAGVAVEGFLSQDMEYVRGQLEGAAGGLDQHAVVYFGGSG